MDWKDTRCLLGLWSVHSPKNSLKMPRCHVELVPRVDIMLGGGGGSNSSAIQMWSSELNTYHFKEDLICFSVYLCPNVSIFQDLYRLNLFYLWNIVILLLYGLHTIKIFIPPSPTLVASRNLDFDHSTCHTGGQQKKTASVLPQAAKSCGDTDGWPHLTYSICAVKQKFLE